MKPFDPGTRPPALSRAGRLFWSVAGALVLGAAGAVAYWYARPEAGATRAARATLDIPRNARPGVAYTGDEACASCHVDIAETFRRHPMGRSTGPVATVSPVERFDAAARNPFERDGFHYAVERTGPRLIHRESRRDPAGRPITELTVDVAYAIGSGKHGRTYLVNRDGYLFQSPVSWFTEKGIWDLTPGFSVREHFERPANEQCLFCHTNRVELVGDSVNHYTAPLFHGFAVGCERCHGPGALHVRRREAAEAFEGTDDTVVNPARLAPALRDAVCQQCHLSAEARITRRGKRLFDYRPGLPLHEFISAWMREPGFGGTAFKSAGHFEQMYESKCYRAAAGGLGCVSCHDPHVLPEPEKKVSYYRDRCLACHADKGCSLPAQARRQRNAADDCTACHMPRGASGIAHTALTDHRIPRVATAPAPPAQRKLAPGEVPFYLFLRDQVDAADPELGRDKGLALVDLSRSYPHFGPSMGAIALPLLAEAVDRAGDDTDAREAYAYVLWLANQREDALAALGTVLEQAPGRETALMYAATFATALGREEAAIEFWRRAIQVNPWLSAYHARLGKLLAGRQLWLPALEAGEAALRLDPANEETLTLVIGCAAKARQVGRAQELFDRLLALNPAEREVYRRWFAEQLP